MVNLYDNPAEAKFIQTYTPIDFEGLKNLAMQAKDDRDKSVEAFGKAVQGADGLGSINDLHNAYYDNLITNPINQLAQEASSTPGTFFNDPANMARISAITSGQNSSEAKTQQMRAKQGVDVKNNASTLGYGDAGYVDYAFSKTIDPNTGRAVSDFGLPKIAGLDDEIRAGVKTAANETYGITTHKGLEGSGTETYEAIDEPKVRAIVNNVANNGTYDDKLKGSYDYEMWKLQNGKSSIATSPLRMAMSGMDENGQPVFDDNSFNRYKQNYIYSVAMPQEYKKYKYDQFSGGNKEGKGSDIPATFLNVVDRGASDAVSAKLTNIDPSGKSTMNPVTGEIKASPEAYKETIRRISNINDEDKFGIGESGEDQMHTKDQVVSHAIKVANEFFVPTSMDSRQTINVLVGSGGLEPQETKETVKPKSGIFTQEDASSGTTVSKNIKLYTKGTTGGVGKRAGEAFFTPSTSVPITPQTKDASSVTIRKLTALNGAYEQYSPERVVPAGYIVSGNNEPAVKSKSNIGFYGPLQAQQLITEFANRESGIQMTNAGGVSTSAVLGQRASEQIVPGNLVFTPAQVAKFKSEIRNPNSQLGQWAKNNGFDSDVVKNIDKYIPNPASSSTYELPVSYHPQLQNPAVRTRVNIMNNGRNQGYDILPANSKSFGNEGTQQ